MFSSLCYLNGLYKVRRLSKSRARTTGLRMKENWDTLSKLPSLNFQIMLGLSLWKGILENKKVILHISGLIILIIQGSKMSKSSKYRQKIKAKHIRGMKLSKKWNSSTRENYNHVQILRWSQATLTTTSHLELKGF